MYYLYIFSQKNFLILNNSIYVVKINTTRKLKYYLNDHDSGNISQKAVVLSWMMHPDVWLGFAFKMFGW
jgi:hypothetical protein